MVVYRVENKAGVGPFTHGIGFRAKGVMFPGVASDCGRRSIDPNYLCGCSSMEELEKWFGDIPVHLEQKGFTINSYEVEDIHVLRGQHQVAFDSTKAKLLSNHSVLELLTK